MSIDLLGFAAHPDDIELSASGIFLKHAAEGYSTGIIDLTQGELGTRGSGKLRLEEAKASAKILGLSARENLNLGDGFFPEDREALLPIIQMIRKYRPRIVLANAPEDRHPDHGRASQLVSRACFLSGLPKINTSIDGSEQSAHRPNSVFHYIQFQPLTPDILLDISPYIDQKIESVRAFSSQFYDPKSTEKETPISSEQFFENIKHQASLLGQQIGVKFAEGLIRDKRPIAVSSLDNIW